MLGEPEPAWRSRLGGNRLWKEEELRCAESGGDGSARNNIRLLASDSKGFERQKYKVMVEKMDLKTKIPNSTFGPVVYIQSV